MSLRRKVAEIGAVFTAIFSAMCIAIGGVVAGGAPAQAVPPGCTHSTGSEAVAGSYVLAYNWWYCDDGQQIPWPATVARLLSSGAYETVASGKGDVFYFCTGTVYNIYRAASRDFGVACS
jgi:hypothetical protein